MITNIFFPKSIKAETLYHILRKNIDILQAQVYDLTNPEVTTQGSVLISLDPDEIAKIRQSINNSRDHYIAQQGCVQLDGTTIIVPALIIETL